MNIELDTAALRSMQKKRATGLQKLTKEQLIAHCESQEIGGVSDWFSAFRELLRRFKQEARQ